MTETARDICDYVRRFPLRRDNKLLQGTGGTSTTVPAGLPSGVLPVEDVCRVVAACSQSFQAQLDRQQSSQSVRSTASPVLAICDASADERAAMQSASERNLRGSDDKSVDMPVAAEQDRRASDTMSVEEQLAALRQEMGQGKPNSTEQEMEPPGAMKKPASSKKSVPAAKPKGRPRAKPKAGTGSGVRKASNQTLKRPASAHMVRRTAPTRHETAAASSTGALSRAEHRQKVLAVVPRKIRQKYADGCARCRFTAGCSPSCWFQRGFEVWGAAWHQRAARM